MKGLRQQMNMNHQQVKPVRTNELMDLQQGSQNESLPGVLTNGVHDLILLVSGNLSCEKQPLTSRTKEVSAFLSMQ